MGNISFPQNPPVIKKGTRRTGLHVEVPYVATDVTQNIEDELSRIVEAAKRKEGKSYPAGTSLIIVFNDRFQFQQIVSEKQLDDFVKTNIITLDLKFSTLFLLGQTTYFREYRLE